jgi:hypothetical protein
MNGCQVLQGTKSLKITKSAPELLALMEEIESYERVGGLKNEISKLVMQKYTVDQICVQRNKAITSLVKLQSYGVTDEEIYNIHEFMNRVCMENGARTPFDALTSKENITNTGSNFGVPR